MYTKLCVCGSQAAVGHLAMPAGASVIQSGSCCNYPVGRPVLSRDCSIYGGQKVEHVTLAPAPVQAVEIGLEGVYEFNACVPYAGVASALGPRVEGTAVAVCLALLHPDLVPGERSGSIA